jgi:hypothetical protein
MKLKRKLINFVNKYFAIVLVVSPLLIVLLILTFWGSLFIAIWKYILGNGS